MITRTEAEWRELALAAWNAQPVPKHKIVYRHWLGNNDFLWEWSCPRCPYRRRSRDRTNLEVEIALHTHHLGPKVPWHPRYRMPPRYGRGLTR